MVTLDKITDLKDEINLDNVAKVGQKFRDMGQYPAARSAAWLLAGAAIGSLLTLYLDPEQGQKRRAQVKDKAVSLGKNVQEATTRRIKDLNQRIRGAATDVAEATEEKVQAQV